MDIVKTDILFVNSWKLQIRPWIEKHKKCGAKLYIFCNVIYFDSTTKRTNFLTKKFKKKKKNFTIFVKIVDQRRNIIGKIKIFHWIKQSNLNIVFKYKQLNQFSNHYSNITKKFDTKDKPVNIISKFHFHITSLKSLIDEIRHVEWLEVLT